MRTPKKNDATRRTRKTDDDVAVGGNRTIAARINQIDWPSTNIFGCKTLKFYIVIVQISVNEILFEETL